jgi:hypothetical protein
MHNNAIGPEICGKPANKDNDFHRARYAGADNKPAGRAARLPALRPERRWPFRALQALDARAAAPRRPRPQDDLTNADLLIDLGIRPLEGKVEKPLGGFGQVKIPMGASAGFLNGLLHKQLIGDLFLAKRDPARLEAAGRKALVPTLQAIADEVLKNPARFVDILREQRDFLRQLRDLRPAGGKRGPPLRRGPVRSRQEGRHRLPRHPVRENAMKAPAAASPCACPASPPAPEAPPPAIAFAPWDKATPPSPTSPRWTTSYPIATAELAKVTPDWLAGLDQEQLDQIYARLTAGPIPDGAFDGASCCPGRQRQVPAAEIVGGFAGWRCTSRAWCWRRWARACGGARFSTATSASCETASKTWPCSRRWPGEGRAAKMDFEGKQTWLLFPAKLYCGQSLLDARRESIIIDYFFTDEIPGYQESPTSSPAAAGCGCATRSAWSARALPGPRLSRQGLRPQLHAPQQGHGRAGREAFVKTGQVQEDCWPGTQPRKLLAGRRLRGADGAPHDAPARAAGCWPARPSCPGRGS